MHIKNKNKNYSFLFITILFCQLLYHAIHLFLIHYSNSNLELSNHSVKIEELYLDCEVCDKMLNNGLYFFIFTSLLIKLVFISFPQNLKTPLISTNRSDSIYPLRGPPFTSK